MAALWLAGLITLQNSPAAQAAADIPIRFLISGGKGTVNVAWYQESADRIEFIVDADCQLHCAVTPRSFRVENQKSYWVVSSYYDPFIIEAQSNAVLAFDLDHPRNCHIIIEPVRGDNVLQNPSFEEVANDLPSGWECRLGNATNCTQRSGKHSVVLRNADANNYAELKSALAAVQSGQEYEASAFYNTREIPYGSSANFAVVVVAKGKPTLYFSCYWLNPLIYGAPDSWRRVFLRFKVPEDYKEESKAGVLVTASGQPFTSYWDDFSLRLAPSVVVQPLKELDKLALTPRYSTEEIRDIMKGKPPLGLRIKTSDRGTRLFLNDVPAPLFGFVAHPHFWEERGNYRDFVEAGIKNLWIPAVLGTITWPELEGNPAWLAEGKYDFSTIDARIERVLRDDPAAAIFLYLGTETYPDFGDKHPNAIWRNSKGEKTIDPKGGGKGGAVVRGPRQSWNISLTSAEYRRQTADALRALGRHLAESDLGKQVAGVHLTGGSDGQWFPLCFPLEEIDRSPDNLEAYRDWLRRRYCGNLNAFRQAWGDAEARFETAEFPSEKERSPEKFFFNFAESADRRIIDANRFRSEGVAETINGFAKAFKEGFRRPVVITTYYPDIMYGAHGGHGALKILLDEPYLDGIVSVTEYGGFRNPGDSSCMNSLTGSLRLHQKLFLCELDYRTDDSGISPDGPLLRKGWGVARGNDELAAQFRRDAGMCLSQGMGCWHYGLGGSSWAQEPGCKRFLNEVNKAAAQSAEHPLPEDHGQMAVFCDEQLIDMATHTPLGGFWGYGTAQAMSSHYWTRLAFNRSGLAWDGYLLSDVNHPRRPAYRLNLFMSAPSITPDQIEWVRKNLQKDHNVLVFFNGAGFCHGNFTENIYRLTGMKVKMGDNRLCDTIAFTPLKSKDPLAAGLPENNWLDNITAWQRSPLFYIDDTEATPLALLEGTNKVGAAVKRFPEWTSIYISRPGAITPRFLRDLAKEAGIEPIGPEGDATFAGNGFLVIHALAPGEKTLRWKGRSDLFDLTAGKTVARKVESYSFAMEAKETRWFRRTPDK